jgi:hypothetical protein
MKSKKQLALIASAVLIVGVVAIVSVGFLFSDRSTELKSSLGVVLKERLALQNSSVTKESLAGRMETDPSGYWSVEIGEAAISIEKAMVDAGFKRSNDDDERYFRSAVQRALETSDLHAFRSYEATLVLGKGTICETTSCNVVILVAEGEQSLFIEIWRI